MTNTKCLNENYSTTRLITKEKAEIINNHDNKFKTVLFLPEEKNRKGEGGLRTKNYFKKSFENKPLISIITVVYNGEKFLEETIKSVINQTYDNVEYIIIDGGSSDGTIDIIKKYEDYIDYWVSEKDNGIYDAMNKGIDLATGIWINFMNAGDLFFDNTIEHLKTNFRNVI
jgi:cellulose synthase/poly-beta-1,6-N-acetylglucosamine synthase-like glycosyltransferase